MKKKKKKKQTDIYKRRKAYHTKKYLKCIKNNLVIAEAKCYSGVLSSRPVLISGSERSSKTVSNFKAAKALDPRSARIVNAFGGFSMPAAIIQLINAIKFSKKLA
jgi:hypothetical protein